MTELIITRPLLMKLTFSQWLKVRRDIAKISQTDIAKRLGIRPQTVSNWENGISKPSLNPEQTQQLCEILKVHLDELVKAFKEEVEID